MKTRLLINIYGAVQGVGFRPFIYKLAERMKLTGIVYNTSEGVTIEVEGRQTNLEKFIINVENEKPQLAIITNMESSYLDPVGYNNFKIIVSAKNYSNAALILPDIAVCKDCLSEMNDPQDRRFKYPFINCTNCGPRFSIIESLPYDRPNTSMKKFKMCDKCREEYENPLDRRFHAQPIACPDCGPTVQIVDKDNNSVASGRDTILFCKEKILEGFIVALKGIGGFQLLADARNDAVIQLMRDRKQRDEKPFALMLPTIKMFEEVCNVSTAEKRILTSPESPIVLLKRKENSNLYISKIAAPSNPYLGVMLPYSPLHHLVLQELSIPVVATSGNISEEPMCISNQEALDRLGDVADYFLINDRPIVRQVDDSIIRIVRNREMLLRRARGYSPLPIRVNDHDYEKPIFALGGHLKNTVCLNIKEQSFLSQHIGDLSNQYSFESFNKVVNDLKALYNIEECQYVSDMHPNYLSTQFADETNESFIQVQHHLAHIAACKEENQVNGRFLGVAFDGTGFGLDGTIWGGEFFLVNDNEYYHAAQFRKFDLPGGETAIKETNRSALGVLFEIFGEVLFENFFDLKKLNFHHNDLKILHTMLVNNINCVKTSSVGRLFDAVSSLLDISHYSSFEGQAAIKLEHAADPNERNEYIINLIEKENLILDWEEMIRSIIYDMKKGISKSLISARFHNSISKAILNTAKYFQEKKVVLSGGCFQNVHLLEKTIDLLERNKIKVYAHQRVPTNDGGISLGQAAALNMKLSKDKLNVNIAPPKQSALSTDWSN